MGAFDIPLAAIAMGFPRRRSTREPYEPKCRYCGATGLHWHFDQFQGWRLQINRKKAYHSCREYYIKHNKPIPRQLRRVATMRARKVTRK